MNRRLVNIELDVVDSLSEIRRPLIDVQINESGKIVMAFVGGVRVRGRVDAHEFIELMLGQNWLADQASAVVRAADAVGT